VFLSTPAPLQIEVLRRRMNLLNGFILPDDEVADLEVDTPGVHAQLSQVSLAVAFNLKVVFT